MAIIPNLAPQPGEQGFQPSLQANVLANQGCVHFSKQVDPLKIETLIVPDQLMAQVVVLWLRDHPDEATDIIRAVKQKQQQEIALINTIRKTKND